MQNFKDLLIWQEAHQLTLKIYESSKAFPKEETFGITSQLRRAAVSIPCNIAEGCGRYTQKDFANFLQNLFLGYSKHFCAKIFKYRQTELQAKMG